MRRDKKRVLANDERQLIGSDRKTQMNTPTENRQGLADQPPTPTTTFAEFLEGFPPSQTVETAEAWDNESRGTSKYPAIQKFQLQLHCTTNSCNGLRFFRYLNGDRFFDSDGTLETYITYRCSNCQITKKKYSLLLLRKDNGSATAYKFGEHPPFGPPTPARLIRLFGKDRDIFLKGRQCENHGLGIGAFVYYRRVVENQKNKIVGEILKVAQTIGAPDDMLRQLEAAINEIQFSKALESVKDAVPQALLINGQNPLALLHSALSIGVHEQTDEHCLELAHDVRVLLVELAERIGQALKDEAELNTAVSRLIGLKKAQRTKG